MLARIQAQKSARGYRALAEAVQISSPNVQTHSSQHESKAGRSTCPLATPLIGDSDRLVPLSYRGAYITLRSKTGITKAVVETEARLKLTFTISYNANCILSINHLEQLPVIFLYRIMAGGNVTVHVCSQVRLCACIKMERLTSCGLWRLMFHAVNGCKAAISPPQAAYAAITAQYEHRCTMCHVM